ncbi:hypothetical protein AC578_10177 [Pseudocercospora eumusae]|uniref:Uncharacterized protein n=1 Tax=Pseudocercospora eumusae TaxID=321146 RepID=A0A139HYX5_9PEZI|nr:hypothetical protein AC578_10177 [Pseudocercospora eumusae]
MASDRHPAIRRLYHHLGILERPSLRKFCLYAKSLTCVIPFPNARDSLSTLYGIITVGKDALKLLRQQPSKLGDFGAYLAITNIAALFELGSPTNINFQLYATAINLAMQSLRPSGNLVSVTGFSGRLSALGHDIYDSRVDIGRLAWDKLADFLNTLVDAWILECARQGVFPPAKRIEDSNPVSEDFLMRGLIWAQFYFPPGWFDTQTEDNGTYVESASTRKLRSQSLPLTLQKSDWLRLLRSIPRISNIASRFIKSKQRGWQEAHAKINLILGQHQCKAYKILPSEEIGTRSQHVQGR